MKNFTFKTFFSLCLLFCAAFHANAQNAVTLTMNDSYGDGWQGCEITIQDANDCVVPVVSGPHTITTGFSGTASIDLPDGCYNVVSSGDTYPSEVSWTLTLDSDGSTVASGGANENITNVTLGSGVCTAVAGCTDPTATNYDPLATCDDGSCIAAGNTGFTITMDDSWGDGWNGGSIAVVDGSDCAKPTVAGPFSGTGSSSTAAISLADGCYEVVIVDGTYPGEISWTITNNSDASVWASGGAPYTSTILTVGAGPCTALVYGCTDPAADNYDPAATCDDGSCLFCVAPTADAPVVAGEDCAAGTYDITVNVTGLGNGTPVLDYGTGSQAAVMGTNTISGLAIGTFYDINLTHGSDASCDAALGTGVGSTLICPVIIDCTAAAFSSTYCYGANATDIFDYQSSDATSQLKITFLSGFAENSYDELTVYDSDGSVIYSGYGAGGDVSTLNFTSSGSSVSWGVLSDGTVQCSSGSGAPIEFTVECISNAPTNDDCVGSVNINGGGVAGIPTGTPVSASTAGASMSMASVGTCGGTPDDDVWFTFTTDTNGGDVSVDIVPSASFSPVCEIYTSCSATTPLICGNATAALSGTAPNTTYYIRVFDASTGFTGSGGAEERSAGDFTIAVSGTALPAELTSFTGAAMDKYNALKWETAAEQNTDVFSIERSLNGQNDWRAIGETAAAGYSDAAITYTFDDMNPAAQAYYRLRTVDFDGSSQVSNIITIKRETTGFDVVLVAPNPTTRKTTVTYESLEAVQVQTVITDITGKTVSVLSQNAERGTNTLTVDLTDAPSGVYFLNMNDGRNSVTRRVVKN